MTDAQIRLYQMQLEGAEQRIAELEAKLKEREDHWRRVHERKIIEHDLRHEKSIAELEEQLAETIRLSAEKHRPAYDEQQQRIAELEAERDRLREALQAIPDVVRPLPRGV